MQLVIVPNSYKYSQHILKASNVSFNEKFGAEHVNVKIYYTCIRVETLNEASSNTFSTQL